MKKKNRNGDDYYEEELEEGRGILYFNDVAGLK